MTKKSPPLSTSKGSGLQFFNNAYQNLKVGQKIISGSLITILLVIIIITIVLVNMNTLTNSFNFLVEHDQPVLANVAKLEKLAVDMETGQRGFIITGEDEFLEPYNAAEAIFLDLLEEEKALVSDNPPQVERLDEISELHNDWLRLAAEPEIAMRREVNEATVISDTLQEILRGRVGKNILDELRNKLSTMEASFTKADNLEAAILAVKIEKDMVDQETGERGFIITGEESFLEPYNAGQAALSTNISALRALLTEDATNSALLDEVETLANDWVEQAAKPEIAARREVDANPATIADVSAMLEVGTGKTILDEMRVLFEEFNQIEVELNEKRSDDATQQAQTTAALAIGFTALGIFITFALGSFISRNITLSLESVTESAEKIIEGDFSSEVAVTSQDEVGDLAGTFNAMTEQLRTTLDALDERSKQVETGSEVSRRLSTILDVEQLVKEVVEQLVTAFDYYYAHIYLFEDDENTLVMKGGTGEAGQVLLSRGHTIPKGRGLVGRAAETNEVILIGDTLNEEGWLPNDLLPDTKAEVAVPISIGENVLGVFDVQHNIVNGLKEEDADLLESIANQIAIAVQNAQAYVEAQEQAEREARITEISTQIQQATTVEDVMKIAVSELGQTLNSERASVELNMKKK